MLPRTLTRIPACQESMFIEAPSISMEGVGRLMPAAATTRHISASVLSIHFHTHSGASKRLPLSRHLQQRRHSGVRRIPRRISTGASLVSVQDDNVAASL
jgi:hypothetical protein